MTLKAKDWRAIRHYAEAHSLRPRLSIPSMGRFYFLDQRGLEVSVGIQTIRNEYDDHKAKDKQS